MLKTLMRLRLRLPLAALLLAVSFSRGATADAGDDQYAVAADHYSNGNWRFAVDEFQVLLEKHANHPRVHDARFFLAESLVQLGKFQRAHDAFLDFLKTGEQHRLARQARFRVGETAYLVGDFKRAKQDLQTFRKAYPQDALNAYALTYLGEIQLRDGKAADAQAIFQQALADFPSGPLLSQCRFGLAQALQKQGETDAALRFYKLLAQQPRRPFADKAQLQRGILHYRHQQYAEATGSLETFQTSYRYSILRDQAGYWLGKTQIAQRRWTDAIRTLTRIVPDDPQDPLAPAVEFALAQALHNAGKPSEAAAHYQRVVGRWPQSEFADDSQQARIQLALEQGDHRQVDALTAKFLQLYGDSPLIDDVRLSVGRSLLLQKKHAAAIAILKELAAIPENKTTPNETTTPDELADSNRTVARYYLALAYLGDKQYAETLAVLDQIPQKRRPELDDSVLVARSAALIGLKQYQQAIAPLRGYLKSQPTGPEAAAVRARLAIALTHTEKFDEARQAYGELVRLHRDDPQLLPTTLYLAEVTYEKNERDWSHLLFTELTRQGNPPEYVAKGRLGLAWLQLKADNPKQSAALFARLLKENPDSKLAAMAAFMRGQALAKLKDHDAALAMYRMVFEKHPESEHAPRALLAAARLHAALKQRREAAELYAALVEKYPRHEQLDSILYQWAWTLTDDGKAKQAARLFDRIHQQHSGSRYWADATYRLAEQAVRDDEHRRAGELIDALLAADDKSPIAAHALYLKGQIAAGQQRWTDVAKPLDQLLTQHPESSLRLQAQYWIAEALYRQDQYQEAGQRLELLSRQAQGRRDAWLAMVPLRRAQVLAHKKQWDQARELAETIPKQFPEFRQQYEVDYLLGRCLASKAQFDQARAAYERVVRSPIGGRTETAAMAQWMIGESYFHQKRYDDAIKAYHRVERLFDYPRWQAGALLQAGKCHEQQRQWRLAIQLYARVLKDFADTDFAEEASRRLSVARKQAADGESSQ